MADAVTFTDENGETSTYYVLEETKLGGMTYLLVADAPEGEADALILKDVSAADADEACYVEVSDEKELESVSRIFEELLGDIEFQ